MSFKLLPTHEIYTKEETHCPDINHSPSNMWVNVPVAERKEGDVKNLLAQRGSKQEEVVEEIILNLVLLLRNLEEAYTHTHTNTRSLGSEDSAAVRSGLGDRLLNLVKNNVV